jgi:hypothetical protein
MTHIVLYDLECCGAPVAAAATTTCSARSSSTPAPDRLKLPTPATNWTAALPACEFAITPGRCDAPDRRRRS